MQVFFRNLALVLIFGTLWLDGVSVLASEGRQRLDADTEYEIAGDGKGIGFSLKVHISRYQFVPDMWSIAENCKAAAAVIAQQEAAVRKIKGKLNIIGQVETGRNPIMGTSSCVVAANFQAAPDIEPDAFSKNPILDAALKKSCKLRCCGCQSLFGYEQRERPHDRRSRLFALLQGMG